MPISYSATPNIDNAKTGEVTTTLVLKPDGSGGVAWGSVAGSGDVNKVGIPVNNEIGVWTGDGSIEGDTNFQWDGSTLTITGNATVTDDAYGAGWNASTEVPTKNALYDKIETLAGSGSMTTVKEGGVQLGGADIVTLDFDGDDFNLTESPDTEVNITVNDAGVDHDATTNFVGNEHIDHTSVTLTAGEGLSGGGDISTNRSFDLDLSELTTDTSIAAGDFIPFRDISPASNDKITFANFEAAVDHDALTNYDINEHFTQANITTTGTVTSGTWNSSFGATANEAIEDVAGGMFTGNTETLITATYQDGDGTVDLVVDNDLANYSNTNSDFVVKSTDHKVKAITIEDPTSSEDITMFFTDDAITITQMNAVLLGSSTPSVTWTIRHNSDRSAAGAEVVTSGTATTSTSTGSEVTSFNDATIAAGSWVWLETTAQSGTVDEINVTLEYTVD